MQEFVEQKDLIVGQMRYFARHLGSADQRDQEADIVDIQVCCDANIFKFLIECCTELHEFGRISSQSAEQLQGKLLFPVLVSSVFL